MLIFAYPLLIFNLRCTGSLFLKILLKLVINMDSSSFLLIVCSIHCWWNPSLKNYFRDKNIDFLTKTTQILLLIICSTKQFNIQKWNLWWIGFSLSLSISLNYSHICHLHMSNFRNFGIFDNQICNNQVIIKSKDNFFLRY